MQGDTETHLDLQLLLLYTMTSTQHLCPPTLEPCLWRASYTRDTALGTKWSRKEGEAHRSSINLSCSRPYYSDLVQWCSGERKLKVHEMVDELPEAVLQVVSRHSTTVVPTWRYESMKLRAVIRLPLYMAVCKLDGHALVAYLQL